MKTIITFKSIDKAVTGIVRVSKDEDISLYPGKDDEEILTIPNDHPCLTWPQDEWEIKSDGSGVQRKPEDVIQKQMEDGQKDKKKAEERARRSQFVATHAPMLKEINALRAKLAMPLTTIDEMYDRA